MITNETEIRIALQAVLISILALSGYWGCAVLVLLTLFPWRPIFAVVGYLAQPVVEWRVQKARERQGKGIAQIEQDLDALLRTRASAPTAWVPLAPKTPRLEKPSHSPSAPLIEAFKPTLADGPAVRPLPGSAHDLSATMSIVPVIKEHVRTKPLGVFHNMELEVEQVSFQGDRADAYVRFQSPNVAELIIRQRYSLRKSGDQWLVESRQPANGGSKMVPQPPLPTGGVMRLT